MERAKRVVLLGATGSIGTQALAVIRHQPQRLAVLGLSAHSRWQELFAQAQQFRPRWVTLTDESLRPVVDLAALPPDCELLWGDAGVAHMIAAADTDVVLTAMVGAAGLSGTLAAIAAAKPIALANKEALVVGGPVVMSQVRERNLSLIPVDSEHSAIHQALRGGRRAEVQRVVLTASGGPFRTTPLDQFANLTVDQALNHPTWNMGPKITIDSATMMNKALELIEAHWLFDLPAEQLAVTIHPQSMVHSFVEFCDGSILAQVSPPDMRLPIQYALMYPERQDSPTRRLDWQQAHGWEFQPPDLERYPALALGFTVIRQGGTCGAALNAANEVAVARFLAGELRFPQIVQLAADLLANHPFDPSPTLATLMQVDRWARQEAKLWSTSTRSFPFSKLW